MSRSPYQPSSSSPKAVRDRRAGRASTVASTTAPPRRFPASQIVTRRHIFAEYPRAAERFIIKDLSSEGGGVGERGKLWCLRDIDLFHGMSEEQMGRVRQRTVVCRVRRREVLYLPGDACDRLYLLERGVVKLSIPRTDGREVLLALLRRGEVFGEEAIFQDAPRDHMAEVHEDATIGTISRRDFLEMLRSHPELVFEVTKLVGMKLKTFRTRVEHLLFKDASQRLAATLLELAQEHGVSDPRGVLVRLRMNQQDLANLIGVTRESVNLALSDLRRRGLVVLEGRAIHLPRPRALRELV